MTIERKKKKETKALVEANEPSPVFLWARFPGAICLSSLTCSFRNRCKCDSGDGDSGTADE